MTRLMTYLSRQQTRHLLIVLCIATLARIIYDVGLYGSVFVSNYTADSLVLHSWALNILAGDTVNLAFFRAPFYPYLLASAYSLFGISVWSAIIMNNIFGLMTVAVTYLCARRLFGAKVAVWSSIVVAVYPTLIYFEGETLITSLAVLLFTLLVYRLLLAVECSSWRNSIILGLVIGLAAITRPTLMPLAVLFPIILLLRRVTISETVLKTVVMIAAMLLFILPVTITNAIRGGEFVLISTQGGANFYIGNSKAADGITVRAPGPNLRIGDNNDNIWTSSVDEAEHRTGSELSQSEVSTFWYKEALSEMGADVGRSIGLYVKKIYYFWHGCEIFNHKPLYFSGEYSKYMHLLVWTKFINFPSGILFPLMFAGMWYAYRDRYNVSILILPLFLFSIVVAAFFICARFRQPVIPLASVFAIYALINLIESFKNNRRLFAISIGLVVLLVVGLNWGGNIDSRDNRSQYHSMIGTTYLNQQYYREGIHHLRKSLEFLPDNVRAYEMIGEGYMRLGNQKKAVEAFEGGLAVDSAYPPFNFSLAVIARTQNRNDEALLYLRRTIKAAPEFTQALWGMASIFERQGQLDSALSYYQKVQELDVYEGEMVRRLGDKIQQLSEQLR